MNLKSNYMYDDSLPKILKDYLSYLSSVRGASSNTIAAYSYDLSLFFKYLKLQCKEVSLSFELSFEDIPIVDISAKHLNDLQLVDFYAYLSYLENMRCNGTYAKARKVASLKSFFHYLCSKAKIIIQDPTLDLESPKIGKRSPIYLTLEESKDLLLAANNREKHSFRDLCIITLFLNCGVRLSELCSINITNIKGDTLTVIGKGNKERTIYLNKASIKSINKYLVVRNELIDKVYFDDRDALFISGKYRRINKRTVERVVKKYVGLAGLDKDKYTPHKLRHTSATLLHKHGGVDVKTLQEILGHENVSTTQIYVHVDDETIRKAVNSNPLGDE
ncbi:MAG: tyrosine recombinase XerC [Clostridium sp.]|uniref:tyrosine recombinase XerC n=1 Tax=Clostridium sp. TaxID=1506 RepID=UPI002FCAC466